MRKMMTKEVTITTLHSGKIIINPETKQPEIKTNEPVELLGTISDAKAWKKVLKKFGSGTTLYNKEEKTLVYEMEVSEFIKVAKLKEEGEPENEQEMDEDEEEEEESEPEPQARKGSIKRTPKTEQTKLEV